MLTLFTSLRNVLGYGLILLLISSCVASPTPTPTVAPSPSPQPSSTPTATTPPPTPASTPSPPPKFPKLITGDPPVVRVEYAFDPASLEPGDYIVIDRQYHRGDFYYVSWDGKKQGKLLELPLLQRGKDPWLTILSINSQTIWLSASEDGKTYYLLSYKFRSKELVQYSIVPQSPCEKAIPLLMNNTEAFGYTGNSVVEFTSIRIYNTCNPSDKGVALAIFSFQEKNFVHYLETTHKLDKMRFPRWISKDTLFWEYENKPDKQQWCFWQITQPHEVCEDVPPDFGLYPSYVLHNISPNGKVIYFPSGREQGRIFKLKCTGVFSLPLTPCGLTTYPTNYSTLNKKYRSVYWSPDSQKAVLVEEDRYDSPGFRAGDLDLYDVASEQVISSSMFGFMGFSGGPNLVWSRDGKRFAMLSGYVFRNTDFLLVSDLNLKTELVPIITYVHIVSYRSESSIYALTVP